MYKHLFVSIQVWVNNHFFNWLNEHKPLVMTIQGGVGATLLAINPWLVTLGQYIQLAGIFLGFILVIASIRYKRKEIKKIDLEIKKLESREDDK